MLSENFYRNFLSKHSCLINLNIKNFLNEEDRLFIWEQPRVGRNDIHGRETTIFEITTPRTHNFLEKKLRETALKHHNFIVDTISLLKLTHPTKPHIDGHTPLCLRYGRRYCISKAAVVPIAFDTETNDIENIRTSFVTFKQHYNYHIDGGLEFDRLFLKNKFYSNYTLEDEKNNKIQSHTKSFINEENMDDFRHIAFQYNGMLGKGLDIDKIYDMKLGDLGTSNPYQIHCTKNYNNFNAKWVLRFLIYEYIR